MRADVAGGRYRLQLMMVVERADTIREGCRLAGIHPSTYYDWRKRVAVAGSPEEAFLPRDSRRRIGPDRVRLESVVIAAALANPSLGPVAVRDRLAVQGVAIGSSSMVWRILKAHGLSRAPERYRLMAAARGWADPEPFPEREWRADQPGKLDADIPGDLVQVDCFHVGRVKEARIGVPKRPGVVWQYTAIDVASSFVWSQVATTAHNPSAIHTSALAFRVADELAVNQWPFTAVTTDRGKEFVDHRFGDALSKLGVEHRYVKRPQSNGKVEQVHNTILREFWKPYFARHEPTSIGRLREALEQYLWYYNYERPHRGRWNQGKIPSQILIPNIGNQP